MTTHIWYRPTDALGEADLRAAEATLSDGELARSRRFRFDEDRRDYVAAHDLLRRALTRCEPAIAPHEWRFETGERGKPYIRSPACGRVEGPLAFSLSHTRGLASCAVGRGLTVGLDVERIDGAIDVGSLAPRCCSARELAAARARRPADVARWFFEIWTLKEAFVKATGLGVAEPLDAISFDIDRPGAIVFSTRSSIGADRWRFALFAPTRESLLAVAVRGETGGSTTFVARHDGDPRAALAAYRSSRAASWSSHDPTIPAGDSPFRSGSRGRRRRGRALGVLAAHHLPPRGAGSLQP